jgi:enoyl-CoA hydratase/carnithine racemase
VRGTVHRRDDAGGVVVLELDNPPVNAMSGPMLRQMADVLGQLLEDLSVRAIVLTGRGRVFCGGADLKEAAEGRGDDPTLFARVREMVAASRAPVIAAINGHCVGGGFELALCCDIRTASTEAKFVCAGVNVGLMASTYRLPRLIGASRAKAMLLTGLPHDAEKAEAWGLVTAVYRPKDLMAETLALAQRIASRAPLSVEASKRSVDRAFDLSPAEAAELTAREVLVLRQSADHKEAVAAFVERRAPQFHRR